MSHRSLNLEHFQAIHHYSPDSPRKHKHISKSAAYPATNTTKEFKSEKCILSATTTLPDHNTHSAHNQKKTINMLKVYKNVLNKMQKTSDTGINNNNKPQKRYSNEFPTSFSTNKVIKPIVQYSASTTRPLTHITNQIDNVATNNNSLKNVNKKAKKLAKCSPQEEIMCDLEVASYFDAGAFKDEEEDELYDCDDGYYFDESKPSGACLKGCEDNMEDESKNLEVLVRQLAAEAALSTLNDSKQANDDEYMKSFNDIFGKVNEQRETSEQYLFRNRSFNNYEMEGLRMQSNKASQGKFYEEENKQ